MEIFNTYLNKVGETGLLYWLPWLFWVAYFFWCRFLDYPAELEKYIRNGKVWPYLPLYWKGCKRKIIHLTGEFIFWIGNISCALFLYYIIPSKHYILLIVGMGVSIFIELKIHFYAIKGIVRLQQDRYFQIYTELANKALSKGNEILDSELLSRAQWQHHNDLRIADKQGRLMAFLKGQAKL